MYQFTIDEGNFRFQCMHHCIVDTIDICVQWMHHFTIDKEIPSACLCVSGFGSQIWFSSFVYNKCTTIQ